MLLYREKTHYCIRKAGAYLISVNDLCQSYIPQNSFEMRSANAFKNLNQRLTNNIPPSTGEKDKTYRELHHKSRRKIGQDGTN